MVQDNYYSQYHRGSKNSQWNLLLAFIVPLSLGAIFVYPKPSEAQQTSIKQESQITAQTIYVNPNRGNDNGSGHRATPLKTITQALQVAQPNTTIMLAPGTYSEATGEKFPLIIQNNITLEGRPQSKGHNIIIQGSGSFISPTGAGQNVTIAAIKDAGEITGITVTNPHTRGHGLWIESANPKVTHSTFTRNGNTGVSVNGKSNPLIANNYFYLNLGNGLLVYGTSKPEVIDNEFNKTGFGVSVVRNAAPTLDGNSFSDNRIGLIFEGNSQGILRNNKVTHSTEYGLVAIANSRVDLGNTTEPGNNTFHSNGKFDIQNITSNPIPALGTDIAGKIDGNVDFNGVTYNNAVASRKITLRSEQPLNNNFSRLRQIPLKDSSNPRLNNIGSSSSAVSNEETLPPPPTIANPHDKELVFSAPTDDNESEIKALPVPDINPPSSPLTNPGNNRQIKSLSDLLTTSNLQVSYRVLVEIDNSNQESQIKSLYPEAFNTVYQGKSMLQVGAFGDRRKAETASRSLADLGLNSHVLDF